MSTGEGEDFFIDEHLVARKDPDSQAWEITDPEGAYRGGASLWRPVASKP
jgi:hypothetical protein